MNEFPRLGTEAAVSPFFLQLVLLTASAVRTAACSGVFDDVQNQLAAQEFAGRSAAPFVAFHSFSAYIVAQPTTPPAFGLAPYDWRVFPIIDNERWLGFDLFCAFQFLYLMQFMFFLSGLFVWPSLQRKDWKGFLAHRLVRLGIPFVIGVYLVMPIAFYPVYERQVTSAMPPLPKMDRQDAA
jgi:Acyltransferase family